MVAGRPAAAPPSPCLPLGPADGQGRGPASPAGSSRIGQHRTRVASYRQRAIRCPGRAGPTRRAAGSGKSRGRASGQRRVPGRAGWPGPPARAAGTRWCPGPPRPARRGRGGPARAAGCGGHRGRSAPRSHPLSGAADHALKVGGAREAVRDGTEDHQVVMARGDAIEVRRVRGLDGDTVKRPAGQAAPDPVTASGDRSRAWYSVHCGASRQSRSPVPQPISRTRCGLKPRSRVTVASRRPRTSAAPAAPSPALVRPDRSNPGSSGGQA